MANQLRTTWLLLGLATLVLAQDCIRKPPDDETLKKAGQIASELMKQCIHLLDKYPVPLSTIADGIVGLSAVVGWQEDGGGDDEEDSEDIALPGRHSRRLHPATTNVLPP
ncbi:hypothetical protein HPB47_015304 [Ixodes persulcatus]|uniref:Uncharacterized protein n=1 Tax=Ixodes persulcatus TaxID=34615 RepID=A0AC60QTY4_IXOPE|nr:hypothetical protein HPB47_015304 [Ixodes persulcatus]